MFKRFKILSDSVTRYQYLEQDQLTYGFNYCGIGLLKMQIAKYYYYKHLF